MTDSRLIFESFLQGGFSILRESRPFSSRHGILNLSNANLFDMDALRLARSPHLASVKKLYLTSNCLGDLGMWCLAQSPYVKQLETIEVSNNRGISSLGISFLLNSPNTSPLGTVLKTVGADEAISESPLLRMKDQQAQLEEALFALPLFTK